MSDELNGKFEQVCELLENYNATDVVLHVSARQHRHETTVFGDGEADLHGEEIVTVHLLEDGQTVRDVDEDVPSLPEDVMSELQKLAAGKWEFYDSHDADTGTVQLARGAEISIGSDGEVNRRDF